MKKTAYWEKNDLSLLFLLSIFMNGFETGGYQAALLYVGQEFDLSIGQQGMLAAVQLFATMIAPLLLGPLADKIGKKIMLVFFTAARCSGRIPKSAERSSTLSSRILTASHAARTSATVQLNHSVFLPFALSLRKPMRESIAWTA